MELTEPVKALLREAAQALTGSERRRFLARTVAGTRPRRAAARGAGTGLEPGDDPQGAARAGQRLRLRRRLRPARAQARRGAPAQPAGRPARRIVDGPEPGRPVLPHDAPVHAADRRRGAPPADRPAGLHRRGAALRADDRGEAATRWGTTPRPWPRRSPKKDRRDRRHLRRGERGQPGGRRGPRHAAGLAGRQGHGQARPVLARAGGAACRSRPPTTTSSRRGR